MVRSMVLSMTMLNAAWQSLPPAKVQALPLTLERAQLGYYKGGRSNMLAWLIMELECSPHFNMAWVALWTTMWRRRRFLLDLRVSPVAASDPSARFLRLWNWQALGDGRFLTRDGVLDLDCDGPATIKQVAVRAWRDSPWEREPRAADSCCCLNVAV